MEPGLSSAVLDTIKNLGIEPSTNKMGFCKFHCCYSSSGGDWKHCNVEKLVPAG